MKKYLLEILWRSFGLAITLIVFHMIGIITINPNFLEDLLK